ncbi:MAG: type II secretion system minor pseudopilin GspI [Gammaproteobacteria bacterium]|nr:type II secretion system minor pseudopilin GspI [Gammaproteobacteria bacterium]
MARYGHPGPLNPPRHNNALKKSGTGLFRGATTTAGFTLIEVLVALAVLAIAMAAALSSVGQSISLSISMRERTVALWVAEERAAHHQLESSVWPGLGTTDGTLDLAGQKWRWHERVYGTETADLRLVDIEVRTVDSEHVLAQLTAALPKP